MNAPSISHWNEQEDGALSERAMTRKLELLGYDVARYVYPPGTYFPDHTHSIDKIDGVVAGRFRLTVAGAEVVLVAGDCIAVPRGTVHSAEVIGDQAVVSLDATKR
jgi:quercetin dioxygenase-like cupin family protein